MTNAPAYDLVLDRLIDAPRDKLFRCWTEPALLKQWFVPAPWTIASADVDPRPGRASSITMRDPDGNEYPNEGVYLEIVPNEKLVFTDAYTAGWVPSEKPFFTGIVTFADEAARRATSRPPATGVRKTGTPTRRWVSTKGGANAPTSSRFWRKGFEFFFCGCRFAWISSVIQSDQPRGEPK